MTNYDFDKSFINDGELLAGIDEAGRGPLAGPVVASAVILNPSEKISGLNDSKKLSEKKRFLLYEIIIKKAVCYSVCYIDHNKIDEINIYQASKLAMLNALNSLELQPKVVLTDAMPMSFPEMQVQAIKKGDTKSASIMAASILAKVERDEIMKHMDSVFPGYNFIKHKGYPTKAHREAIQKLGPCLIHRKSFTLLRDT